MTCSIKVRPLNSFVVIADSPTEVPDFSKDGAQIASTADCIIVSCWPEQDGPTSIAIEEHPENPRGQLVFDAFLRTPHCQLVVWGVPWERLLQAAVPTTQTRVRVWTNHPKWPDDVLSG